MVAYTVLALAEGPMTSQDLRIEANTLLATAGMQIEFDVDDAVAELRKLHLLHGDGDRLEGLAPLPEVHKAVSLAVFERRKVGRCALLWKVDLRSSPAVTMPVWCCGWLAPWPGGLQP
jgi:hypothetical protein